MTRKRKLKFHSNIYIKEILCSVFKFIFTRCCAPYFCIELPSCERPFAFVNALPTLINIALHLRPHKSFLNETASEGKIGSQVYRIETRLGDGQSSLRNPKG